ncbi:MarR family winged helix-turn-helix transcriptional regulator [Micromonospora sp. NPDC005324]|uniref:MarR family winged helix-turn-helix transcriptional regulator n=1 Tax=Micromonospora sp. NPDC005324 TaxID=3157033 RepID=UPI0033B4747B
MPSRTPSEAAEPHRLPGSGPSVGEPRWLDDEQQLAWRANAAIMIRLPAALDARMHRETGLTYFEYMVLSSLSEADDHTLRMGALASRTSSSLSRLSHVAGRLEKQGLLQRSRVPGSGRRTNATLTAAGYAKVAATAPGHVAAVREYFIDVLEPNDLATLRRIGAAVAASIDRDIPGPSVTDMPTPGSSSPTGPAD